MFLLFFGWIRDGEKSGSGIRDKHPGSATLLPRDLILNIRADNDPAPDPTGKVIADRDLDPTG